MSDESLLPTMATLRGDESIVIISREGRRLLMPVPVLHSTVQASIAALTARADALTTRVDALTKRVIELEARPDGVATVDLEALAKRVTTLEEQIKA
jgi:hypothetical protein